jgi:hypothetical protein
MRLQSKPLFFFILLAFAGLACRLNLGSDQIPPAEATLSALQTQVAQLEQDTTHQQQIDSAKAADTSLALPTNTPRPMSYGNSPKIILQRLAVTFLGLDGQKKIGSGCPGTDGKGAVENYHLLVSGVDESQTVERVLVAGDNSTLTWASPCSNNWALVANDLGKGEWEVFFAPSLPSRIYTVMFFYEDTTIALGMAVGQ